MSRISRRRITALVLSLVPGWGHVYWGRETLGLTIFTVAAICGFSFLNGLFIYQGEGREVLTWTSGTLSAITFIAAWVELFFRTSPAREERERTVGVRLLHQGTIAYLKNDSDNAALLFRECLRIDPQDVEALFRLGVTFARRGDKQQALRWLRRTLSFDVEEKWHWEVHRELMSLNEKSEAAEVVNEGGSKDGGSKERESESASA